MAFAVLPMFHINEWLGCLITVAEFKYDADILSKTASLAFSVRFNDILNHVAIHSTIQHNRNEKPK